VPAAAGTLAAALTARFPAIPLPVWEDRLRRGLVTDGDGRALGPGSPHRTAQAIFYRREVNTEVDRPVDLRIVHADAHLLVVDKPAGLVVMPTGPYVRDTLVERVAALTGHATPVALHRLDRDTAGLVLLSVEPATRAAYQALFRQRQIRKHYEAWAPPLPDMTWPAERRSRLERGEPFFRMRETAGEPNTWTRIDVLERRDALWRYALEPVTGAKHQLRVHMSALGAAILGDPLYPEIRRDGDARLALLARRLTFRDPLMAVERVFESTRHFDPTQRL
jgi:tRNA pseudouridine32 synthase / 23S rRNA pseudouridine746 synthase